jgi:hypothetical protein
MQPPTDHLAADLHKRFVNGADRRGADDHSQEVDRVLAPQLVKQQAVQLVPHAGRFTELDNFQISVKTVASGRSRPPFAAETFAPLSMPGGKAQKRNEDASRDAHAASNFRYQLTPLLPKQSNVPFTNPCIPIFRVNLEPL